MATERARSRRTGRCVAVWPAVALAGCGALLGGGREVRLELRSPHLVAEADDAHVVLRNPTGDPVVVPRPTDAFVLVSGATGEGDVLRCETPPPPREISFVTVPAGGELAIPVDLLSRCEAGPQRDFRMSVRFSVPPEVRERPGGGSSWVGTTEPARFQVLRAPEGPRLVPEGP